MTNEFLDMSLKKARAAKTLRKHADELMRKHNAQHELIESLREAIVSLERAAKRYHEWSQETV